MIHSTPLRILTIAQHYVIGLNRRLCRELSQLDEGALELTVIAPKRLRSEWGDLTLDPLSPKDRYTLVPTDVWGSHPRWPQLSVFGRAARGCLQDKRWDVVHCSQEPYTASGAQVAWRTPSTTRLVYMIYQNLSKSYPPPFAQWETYAMKRSSGWIAGGVTVLEAQRNRPYRAARPHEVIPFGVDTDVFRPDPAAGAATRTILGWEDGAAPVVGYLGRFVPEKGLLVLCAALDALKRDFPDMSCRVLFVGAGPLEAELRAFAARWGKDKDQVRVVTGVKHAEVPRWINAMDMLVAPSQTLPAWKEQLGRMLLEAMACGVPVIGSDSGEIPHVLANAGVVVPEAATPDWTRALADLIANPQKRAAYADAGRQRIADRFTWTRAASAHRDFFRLVRDRPIP